MAITFNPATISSEQVGPVVEDHLAESMPPAEPTPSPYLAYNGRAHKHLPSTRSTTASAQGTLESLEAARTRFRDAVGNFHSVTRWYDGERSRFGGGAGIEYAASKYLDALHKLESKSLHLNPAARRLVSSTICKVEAAKENIHDAVRNEADFEAKSRVLLNILNRSTTRIADAATPQAHRALYARR